MGWLRLRQARPACEKIGLSLPHRTEQVADRTALAARAHVDTCVIAVQRQQGKRLRAPGPAQVARPGHDRLAFNGHYCTSDRLGFIAYQNYGRK